MKGPLPLRLALALALSIGLAVLLVLVLYLTDLGLRVWDRLQDAGPVVWSLYGAALALLAGVAALLIWRVLWPGRGRAEGRPGPVAPPSEEAIRQRMERAEGAGMDLAVIRAELAELGRRREAGEIHVAVFGEVSTGKSSLIQALLPDAGVAVDPRAGTTRGVSHHAWVSPAGDRLLVADLPGLDEAGRRLDPMAREEAERAHAVVYVCEGDLTRTQLAAIDALQDLGKPLIVAVNKVDRLSDEDLDRVMGRLRERLGSCAEIVAVRAGGTETVVRVHAGGREERGQRPREPQVEPLRRALQRIIDGDRAALERLRDAAVFQLAGRKLDAELTAYRRRRADAVVKDYSRKAAFGAMAAVGPGTDLLIQGYLGMNMLKELCTLYEADAREVDLERFLGLASSHVKRHLNLLLALAGNMFKAFPGAGTVVGGMVHAVAYGLIFESLGKAVARTLELRGRLAAGPTLQQFEENLVEDLESRARRLVSVVATKRRDGA